MTHTTTHRAASAAPWHTPAPGPIAVLTHPNRMRNLMRTLRAHASRHDDTAWVHPNVNQHRDALANLGQDLLDAIGVVGLTQPRAHGEAHLLRPLTHIVHGPIRHVIVDDAVLLPTDVLTELHETAIIGRTQLWILVDTADGDINSRNQRKAAAFLEWVNDTCTPRRPDTVEQQWRMRPVDHPGCQAPDAAWWLEPLQLGQPLPVGCAHHANDLGSGRIDCLLAWLRCALTAGHLAPGIARRRLAEYAEHPAATVADRWALTAAGRDLLTPGADALRLTHPTAPAATLADVETDGSSVRIGGDLVAVAPEMRLAIARLRTSRRLAGCLKHEPMYGLFDQLPGIERRR
ncbi:hypothetical protein ASC64_04220 [Nocardioides sp. Root122]|nr:hypothetical protein ASC64_04220 [Nocardioides sp. Root122]